MPASQDPGPGGMAPPINPGDSIKLCRRCNQHKPLTQFYRSKANVDGYDGRCKACDAVQCAERRKRKRRVEVCMFLSKDLCRRLSTASACFARPLSQVGVQQPLKPKSLPQSTRMG